MYRFSQKVDGHYVPKLSHMKHTSTFTLLLTLGLGAFAQSMPYNPDSNGDAFVGVDDVLGVLGVYNTALIDSTLTCDYEGTELETLLAGLFSEELVLDSVYIEYFLIDSQEIFQPGCPDPVLIETVLDRSYMMTEIQIESNPSNTIINGGLDLFGFTRGCQFYFNMDNGRYQVSVYDNEVGSFTQNNYSSYTYSNIPFPSDFLLDENGIQSEGWDYYGNPNNFVQACSEFRLIPFWHEAY